MDLLIKSATIVDSKSEWNGKIADIYIIDGKISKIGANLKTAESVEIFKADNLHVSAGWFDMQVNFNDPGLDHRENLESGSKAAAAGGFTGVACMSSKHTPTQNKAHVEYIRNKAQNYCVDVYPIAALSLQMQGKEMSEMYEMHNAGAVAFSDNKKSIEDSGFLSRVMLYAKGFDASVLHFPEDTSLANKGKINEGVMSTQLGVKGIPALAEELVVARDIALADYNQSKIHLMCISTAKSVELVKAAKKNGIKITCSVAVPNLVVTENALEGFDSNYKVQPPLRSQTDVAALWKGLEDGTIDAICSDHTPHDTESKELEFEHAEYGMIGLESAFALLNTAKSNLSLTQLIDKITSAPRNILKLPILLLKEGSQANLTLFSPDLNWEFTPASIYSKSKNTPFIGTPLKGKALGIFNKNQFLKF
jgi:dihydroorotase